MNLKDLVSAVAAQTGFSKKVVEAVVRGTFGTITDAVADGKEVSIPNFGKFEVVTRAARTARNPQTGETINVPETKSPKFKFSLVVKKAVKGE